MILFYLQSEHFSFLGTNVAVTEMRNRSMFYTSLGRLFLVDFNEDEERFDNFMMPITSKRGILSVIGCCDCDCFM